MFLLFQRVPLTENSAVIKSWKSPPVTPLLRLYFFNFTNPDGFLAGEKPKLREVGPYVYRQKWQKENVRWFDGGEEVEYEQTKTFHFAPDLSVGTEDDIVTLPNVPMIVSDLEET